MNDITKAEYIVVTTMLDPQTFLVNLRLETEKELLCDLKLTLEQLQTLKARLMGVSEYKIEAFGKLLKDEATLAEDENRLEKIRRKTR